MSKPVFPLNPFQGQIFIDQNNIQWIYEISQDVWIWLGPVFIYPVAKSGNNCEVEQ